MTSVMKWTKREELPDGIDKRYTEIWDSEDGAWQINYNREDKHWVLIDAGQPHDLPASPVVERFMDLYAAQLFAELTGPIDWSEYKREFGDN